MYERGEKVMPVFYNMCSQSIALEALKRACNELLENVYSTEAHLIW